MRCQGQTAKLGALREAVCVNHYAVRYKLYSKGLQLRRKAGSRALGKGRRQQRQ